MQVHLHLLDSSAVSPALVQIPAGDPKLARVPAKVFRQFISRGTNCESNDMKEAPEFSSSIRRGAAVVVVLHSPREKCWGMLDDINQAGVFLRGLDLNSFDDWVSAVVHAEPFVGFGDLFFPMWRVERISKDETAGGVPSLREQVERRTGKSIEELL